MGRSYDELRRKILGKYGNLGPFAGELGIQPGTLSLKLQGRTDWKREEIEKTANLLDLDATEVWLIFFA